MQRRHFLKTATAGAALSATAAGDAGGSTPAPKGRFIPCINQATTMKADFRTAMDAYAKAGFRAVELWLDSVQPFLAGESVATARRVIADHGLSPVSSCCEEDLFFPRVKDREKKLEAFRRKLDLSAQLGAARFVMYSAIFEAVSPADYDAALPALRTVGDLGKEFGIVVGIEFIRGARFLGCLETTVNLLRRLGHSHLGVLVDTFHFHAGISKLEDFSKVRPGEISFVHIDDVPAMPRELLEDRDRVFVGAGVMRHEKMLAELARVYEGPVSFEVFQYGDQDPYETSRRGFEGLSRLLKSLEKQA